MLTLKDIDIDGQKMSIKIAYPPNIDDIEKVFPGVKARAIPQRIYFCYGDTIYNPCGRPMQMQIIAHEVTHSIQQRGIGPALWWQYYLADKKFRFEQELEAHRVEFEKYALDNPGRAFKRRYITMISERLAGPLYGKLVNKKQAKALILGHPNEPR